MSLRFWKQASTAFHRLNPDHVYRESVRPFRLGLVGSEAEVSAMEAWLVPPELRPDRKERARQRLFLMPVPLSPGQRAMLPGLSARLVGLSAAEEVCSLVRDYTLFLPEQPEIAATELPEAHPELALALARHFPPFRGPVVEKFIKTVAFENAGFAILSALPDVVPNPFELPWALGEFASDTVVLTANQARLALVIAAASDSPVGFLEQKGQMASIVGSAFGWRALARELAGKIPAGGGLVVKGLIAYAVTYTWGVALERFHRFGRRLTRAEKKLVYQEALHSGRAAVEQAARRVLNPHGALVPLKQGEPT